MPASLRLPLSNAVRPGQVVEAVQTTEPSEPQRQEPEPEPVQRQQVQRERLREPELIAEPAPTAAHPEPSLAESVSGKSPGRPGEYPQLIERLMAL